MASVPLSVAQLEAIVETVSRDLLQQWAIDDRFTEEEMEKAIKNSVYDTIFVVNGFMSMLNETMLLEAEKSKLI